MDDPIFQAAVSLNESGLIVVPIRSDKKPCIRLAEDGFRDRWKREGQHRLEVEELFKKIKPWGVALDMWPVSNVVGIDCDGVHGRDLLGDLGIALPETYEEMSPGGGTHLVFNMPDDPPRALQRMVRVVKDECAWRGKGCGVDFMVNGYLIVSPSPRYTPTNSVAITNRATLPREFFDHVLSRSQGRADDGEQPAPDWLEKLLAGPVHAGMRNISGIRIAGRLAQEGMDRKAIKLVLHTWSQSKCVPPMSEPEFKDLWKGVLGVVLKEERKQTAEAEEWFGQAWTATRFAESIRGRGRYSQPAKRWNVWTTSLWKEDDMLTIEQLGAEVVTSIIEEAQTETNPTRKKHLLETAMSLMKRSGFDAMLEMAKKHLTIHPDEFDRDLYLFNLQNGTFNTQTGILQPHSPNDFITKISSVEFHGLDVPCPKFDRFMNQIFPNKAGAEKQAFLDQMIGSALTGDVSEHRFMILYGTGANGKGTLVNVLKRILGTYFRSAPSDLFIQRKGDRHEEAFNFLRGARLAVVSETDKWHVLDSAKIKAHVSTDTVTSRGLYRDRVQYTPQYTVLWMTNHRPRVFDNTKALWRRLVLINFDVTIAEEDRIPNFEATFEDELPGILARYLRGCLAWMAMRRKDKGIEIPPAIRKDVETYRRTSDPVMDFIARRCVVSPEASIKRTEFTKQLKAFAFNTGRKWTPPAPEVNEHLRGEGYGEAKRDGTRFWVGIDVLPENQENEIDDVETVDEPEGDEAGQEGQG